MQTSQSPANEVSLQISQALAAHLKYSPEQLEAIESSEPLIAAKDRCLSAVYHATGNIPLWVNDNGPTERAAIARTYLHAAATEGLRPEDYETEEIGRLWSSLNTQDLALLDTLITYNLLLYAHDVSYGQLESHSTNPKIFFDTGRQDFDPLVAIKSIIAAPDLTAYLAALPPSHQHYKALKNALKTYRADRRSGRLEVDTRPARPCVQAKSTPACRPSASGFTSPAIWKKLTSQTPITTSP